LHPIAVEIQDPDYRMQGRKRISGDFRMRGGNFSQQGGLACVWIADQGSIRHGSELEKKMPLLAFLTFTVLDWRPIAGAFEMHIPFPAGAAMAQEKFFAIAGEISQRRFFEGRINNGFKCIVAFIAEFIVLPAWNWGRRAIYHRPDRHLYDFRKRRSAVHFFSLSVAAILRLDDRLVEKSGKIIGVNIRAQDYVPSPPAITAIRAATRHKFLAPKTDAAASAVPGLGKNCYSIDKHREGISRAASCKLASSWVLVIPSRADGEGPYNDRSVF
jgi:hypothetical protein